MNNPQSAIRNPQLDYIHPSLRRLAVPIDQLILDPHNARQHSDENISAIAGSLQQFGQLRPAVAQRHSRLSTSPTPCLTIRAGEGMARAARKLGWTHLACLPCDDADQQAAAYALADNYTATLAEWDDNALGQLLTTIDAAGLDDRLAAMLDAMPTACGLALQDSTIEDGESKMEDPPLEERFDLLIQCETETQQTKLLTTLKAEGHNARVHNA